MQYLLSKSLRRLTRLYSQAIAETLPDLRSEHDSDILLLLGSSSNIPTQKELSETLPFDKSRTAILIEGLKQQGFIYTERNPIDRRAHFVFLTSKGKEIIPQIQKAINQLNLVLSQQFDQTKLKLLLCNTVSNAT